MVGSVELERLDKKRQSLNIWVIGLAMAGLALGVLENELYAPPAAAF